MAFPTFPGFKPRGKGAGTVRVGEKMHYSRRGQRFLAKKRTIPGGDNAS